jgi:hypothetical protein
MKLYLNRLQRLSPRRNTNLLQTPSVMDGIAQSVLRQATGWTVRGSNLCGAKFSAPVQTGSEAHPASCTMGTRVFPGGEVAGAWR